MAAVPFEDLKDWIKELHTLLVKISAKHAEFTTWSVTVGTPFSRQSLISRMCQRTRAPQTTGGRNYIRGGSV